MPQYELPLWIWTMWVMSSPNFYHVGDELFHFVPCRSGVVCLRFTSINRHANMEQRHTSQSSLLLPHNPKNPLLTIIAQQNGIWWQCDDETNCRNSCSWWPRGWSQISSPPCSRHPQTCHPAIRLLWDGMVPNSSLEINPYIKLTLSFMFLITSDNADFPGPCGNGGQGLPCQFCFNVRCTVVYYR